MHAGCLVAEYKTHPQAKVGLEVLRKFDFHPDAISVVWRGHGQALQKVDRHHDKTDPHEVEKTMGVGAAIAAVFGTPVAITTVMGPIMIAGPLLSLIGGAAIGGLLTEASRSASGATAGTSVGGSSERGLFAMANHWGIHRHAGEHYEEKLAEGSVLIIVTSTSPRLDEAQRALQTTDPATLDRFAYKHPDKTV